MRALSITADDVGDSAFPALIAASVRSENDAIVDPTTLPENLTAEQLGAGLSNLLRRAQKIGSSSSQMWLICVVRSEIERV